MPVGKLVGDEDRVLAREAHLRSILETIPDAMIVIDERGRILSFSAAAEKMFGFSEDEVRGENVSTLMPSPDRERHDLYLSRYMATGNRKIIGIGRVTTARHRDGTTFPIHLHVGEAKIGEERVFTGFIRDLTERQQTELRLHDLQEELAHVSRVTAMGTLATSIAHELNQPLTAIANYVETAEELLQNCDEETLEIVREAMKDCAQQSVRAGQIVRRLRDFISRGESERRIESLERVVNEASALAMVGAGERGIALEVRLDPAVDRVLIERIQVQQVILNLVLLDRRDAAQLGGDGGQLCAPASHHLPSGGRRPCPGQHRGQRAGPRAGGCGAAVPALRQHQGGGNGSRPVDLPHHHPGTGRPHLDGDERVRRHRLQLHLDRCFGGQ